MSILATPSTQQVTNKNSLAQLRVDVLIKLREEVGNPTFWTFDEVDGYLNKGYKLLCKDGDFIISEGLLTLQTSVSIYDLPSDLVEVSKFYLDCLTQKSRLRFSKASGTPLNWDYFGAGKIMVDPIPAATDSGDTADFEYRAYPALLSADADEVINILDVREGVFNYALYEALDKEGDGQDKKRALFYYNEYEKYKAKALLVIENMKPAYVLAGGR